MNFNRALRILYWLVNWLWNILLLYCCLKAFKYCVNFPAINGGFPKMLRILWYFKVLNSDCEFSHFMEVRQNLLLNRTYNFCAAGC